MLLSVFAVLARIPLVAQVNQPTIDWARQFFVTGPSQMRNFPKSVAVDATGVYVLNIYKSNQPFPPARTQMFLRKFDFTGADSWERQVVDVPRMLPGLMGGIAAAATGVYVGVLTGDDSILRKYLRTQLVRGDG